MIKGNLENYKGVNGNYQMNCLLNDAQIGLNEVIEHIENGDGESKYLDTLKQYRELIDFAIDNTEFNPEKKCREKPRTRIEYEKVTESIFDLRDEFERGELHGDDAGVTKIETLAHLGACCHTGNVFKRVEKEIDERQEFIERAEKLIYASKTAEYSLGQLYDAGCRFQD